MPMARCYFEVYTVTPTYMLHSVKTQFAFEYFSESFNIFFTKFKFKFIGISSQYMPLAIYKKLLYGKDNQK